MLASRLLPRQALFLASARFSSLSTKGTGANVTILGSGLMGNGIAQVTAAAGYNVTLFDINNDLLKKGMGAIEKNSTRVALKAAGGDEAKAKEAAAKVLSKITTSTDLAAACSAADLVIEVVVENIEIKHKVFKTIDASAPKTCLFASNTSSLSCSDIASVVSADRQTKFGVLHFFNPVPAMKLVEVARIAQTSDDTFDSLTAFGKSVGKTTVSCKDTAGFIVNRLLIPYMMEAIRMVERGDASVEDIDVAMKLGCGYPMGPLTLADFVGLDTTKYVIDGWHKRYPNDELFKPSPLLDKLVAEGKLGNKTGQGFYTHQKK